MGLFGNKNNSKTWQGPTKDQIAAVDQMVNDLKNKGIKSNEQIAAALYDRAMDTLKHNLYNNVNLYDAILLKASQLGHTESMVQLGFVVEGEHDYSRACEFFKQAADLGDGEGAFSYADRLMNGKGVPKDESLAIMYYKLAMKSDSRATGKAATIVGAYMSRIGKTDEAIAAYQRALDKGFEPIHTRMCLNKLMKKKD